MCAIFSYTVIRFVWLSAKFGTCTVVIVNGTLVEDKMRRFNSECAHFSFNLRPIYTDDGASAKSNTNSHETDNSVRGEMGVGAKLHDVFYSFLLTCSVF
jgi:hypothetical protein